MGMWPFSPLDTGVNNTALGQHIPVRGQFSILKKKKGDQECQLNAM